MMLQYEIKQKLNQHPICNCYEISFYNDNDLIFANLFLPKENFSKIIFEVPDYMSFPKDDLNLSRYALLGYAVVSIHVRGQRGKSKNSTPFTQYSPFDFEEEYYFSKIVEDLEILNEIIDEKYPNLTKYGVGIGLGASMLVHLESKLNLFNELFISNILLSNFDEIIDKNLDTKFYQPIRTFIQNHPHNILELKNSLSKLDVVNVADKIRSKVYYGLSHLDDIAPYVTQVKFVESLEDVEVIHYRKFGHEVLQEHFFDELILKKL